MEVQKISVNVIPLNLSCIVKWLLINLVILIEKIKKKKITEQGKYDTLGSLVNQIFLVFRI